MNASSWRKAADLVAQGTQNTQQIQAAATADSSQLQSFSLSSLAANDSDPPQMNYGTEQPLAVSTPRSTQASAGEIQPTDTYRQIIPGMSEQLYPTLAADGSLSTPAVDDCSTLHRQITSELDKYLQEAADKHKRDDNYYDGQHMPANTSNSQQEANFLEDDDAGNNEEATDPIILESHEKDTGVHHNSPSDCQNQVELDTILEEELEMEEQPDPADQDTLVFTSDESEEEPFNTAIDTTSILEEELEMEEQPDPADQDTLVFTSDESKEEPFNTAIDTTSDDSTILMGKPVTTAFISDQV